MPKGPSVSARSAPICSRTESKVRYPARRKPRPPASETAAASSGVEGPPAMGAWTIGCSSRESTRTLESHAQLAFQALAPRVRDLHRPGRPRSQVLPELKQASRQCRTQGAAQVMALLAPVHAVAHQRAATPGLNLDPELLHALVAAVRELVGQLAAWRGQTIGAVRHVEAVT